VKPPESRVKPPESRVKPPEKKPPENRVQGKRTAATGNSAR
jgi:hypothetical protein